MCWRKYFGGGLLSIHLASAVQIYGQTCIKRYEKLKDSNSFRYIQLLNTDPMEKNKLNTSLKKRVNSDQICMHPVAAGGGGQMIFAPPLIKLPPDNGD